MTLDYPADVTDPEQPVDRQKPGDIVFDSVSFCYPGNDTERLHDISLEIKQGTTLGVVGKTGAGKSTLFKQLLRQYPPGKVDCCSAVYQSNSFPCRRRAAGLVMYRRNRSFSRKRSGKISDMANRMHPTRKFSVSWSSLISLRI